MNSEIKVIAGLDIETLSLDYNAVVFQVGVAVETFVPPSTVPVPDAELQVFNPKTYSFGLDILTQLLEGRTSSKSTMDFHAKVAREHGIDFQHQENRDKYFHQHPSQSYSRDEAVDALRKIFSEVQEIWVNHPEFDIPRLNSALGVTSDYPLFHFRKIRDIHTIRKSGISIREIKNETRSRHDATLDATWNLQVALAWHYRVHHINHLESTLLDTTKAKYVYINKDRITILP